MGLCELVDGVLLAVLTESCSLISSDSLRYSHTLKVHCYHLSSDGFQWHSLRIPRSIIAHNQDIFVATSAAKKRAHNIHCNPVERFSNYWLRDHGSFDLLLTSELLTGLTALTEVPVYSWPIESSLDSCCCIFLS